MSTSRFVSYIQTSADPEAPLPESNSTEKYASYVDHYATPVDLDFTGELTGELRTFWQTYVYSDSRTIMLVDAMTDALMIDGVDNVALIKASFEKNGTVTLDLKQLKLELRFWEEGPLVCFLKLSFYDREDGHITAIVFSHKGAKGTLIDSNYNILVKDEPFFIKIQETLQRELAKLELSLVPPYCPSLGTELQFQDKFCQTWATALVFLQLAGFTATEAIQVLGDLKIIGLIAFAKTMHAFRGELGDYTRSEDEPSAQIIFKANLKYVPGGEAYKDLTAEQCLELNQMFWRRRLKRKKKVYSLSPEKAAAVKAWRESTQLVRDVDDDKYITAVMDLEPSLRSAVRDDDENQLRMEKYEKVARFVNDESKIELPEAAIKKYVTSRPVSIEQKMMHLPTLFNKTLLMAATRWEKYDTEIVQVPLKDVIEAIQLSLRQRDSDQQ